MTGRPGRRRRDPSSPLVDLEVVFADDEMVDAIAASAWGSPRPRDELAARARRPGPFGQPARPGLLIPEQPGHRRPQSVDPLAELFGLWRQELAAVPIPAPPPIRPAVVPKTTKSRRRALRPALSIAAAIAMLLAGSATVGAKSADPDDVLWPITVMVWPDRAQSVQSVLEVREALAQAQSAIDDGRPEDAKLALLRAAVQLGNVDDVDGRADMELAVTDLWAASVPPDQAPTAQARQVDRANPTGGPTAAAGASGANAPVGATSATPAPAVVGALGAPVPAGPLAADRTADGGVAQAGAGGSATEGSATEGSGTEGSGTGGSGVAGSGAVEGGAGGGSSSGAGASSGSGTSSGSGDEGRPPVVAAVAIPTPPVSVDTPTAPTPVASATEQSPPTPSQTTDPSEPGGDGGKPTGGDPLIIDGSDSESADISDADHGSSSSAESAVTADSAGG